MNDGANQGILKIRIALIATSTILVSVPQLLWAVYGYRGLSLILAESFLIVLGFAVLLISLLEDLPPFLMKFVKRIWPDDGTKTFLVKHRDTLLFLQFFILVYVAVPFLVSEIMRYSRPPTFYYLIYGVLTALAIGFLVNYYRKKRFETGRSQLSIIIVIFALSLLWAFAFWYGSPRYPTDEFAIDLYSAHVFINGLNPYIQQHTANVFSFYQIGQSNFPVNVVTPYASGGFVTSLSYPAISVFAFIPANLIGHFETASLIPLYAIPPVVVYAAYHRKKFGEIALIPVFVMLLNPSYLGQVGLGYTDIIWMIFTMLSLYYYDRPVYSGILMAAALSVKQIPWLLFPFMLIFIYRESGRNSAIKWAALSVLGFLLINAVFIIQSPLAFIQAIGAPELQHIIGIGFGPSQISFLDILHVPKLYFSLMAVSSLVASLLVYSVYYKKLRYAFLAFPVIIFMFNYRLLLDYLLFWPLIALMLPPMIKKSRGVGKSKPVENSLISGTTFRHLLVPLLVIVILVAPALYVATAPQQSQSITIYGAKSEKIVDNNVTAISVTIHLNGNNLSYGDLLYRIMPSTSSLNMNGYIWESSSVTSTSGNSSSILIVPINPSQNISWDGNYRLIVYYGESSEAIAFNLNSGVLTVR